MPQEMKADLISLISDREKFLKKYAQSERINFYIHNKTVFVFIVEYKNIYAHAYMHSEYTRNLLPDIYSH